MRWHDRYWSQTNFFVSRITIRNWFLDIPIYWFDRSINGRMVQKIIRKNNFFNKYQNIIWKKTLSFYFCWHNAATYLKPCLFFAYTLDTHTIIHISFHNRDIFFSLTFILLKISFCGWNWMWSSRNVTTRTSLLGRFRNSEKFSVQKVRFSLKLMSIK